MSLKSFAKWEAMKVWCRTHPGKVAAIFTPEGYFTIVWTSQSKRPPSINAVDPSATDPGKPATRDD